MILDRSLEDRWSYYNLEGESRLITLERLAAGGFFKNNRQMIMTWHWLSVPRLFRVVRSMTDLETLNLSNWKLTLTEDVPKLFRSCPKLTELHLTLLESPELEMNEDLKSELRSGFQRLKIFELKCDIESWPVIQEIFT
jgi:hypothetical protein